MADKAIAYSKTVCSGCDKDDIKVTILLRLIKIIMERLGGGGHLNIAGAQLEGVDIDEARVKVKEVLTQMTKEGAI